MQKIMFNDRFGLTDAVLQGRKTMTRRLVGNRMTDDDIRAYLKGYTELADNAAHYKVGEVVAVAQPYKDIRPLIGATQDCCPSLPGWDNKMFVRADLMPHQIRITNIKVERLQDISDEDCMKEGIFRDDIDQEFPFVFDVYGKHTARWRHPSPREAYAALIDKISGKGTWESNPFVFVYTFKLIK